MRRVAIVVAAIVLLAGCSTNSTFVYQPSATAEVGRMLPVKLAVLPFADATEDFTKRGSVLAPEGLTYNLAKAGISGQITALTPELWAKGFADETAASRDFRVVRFLYGAAELSDEDFIVEGAVEKATFAGSYTGPNEFALALKATRRADNRTVWGKTVTNSWATPRETLYKGCGEFGLQCMVDRHKDDINRAMREIFGMARADLFDALAPLARNRDDDALLPEGEAAEPAPVSPGSVEETIENILRGR